MHFSARCTDPLFRKDLALNAFVVLNGIIVGDIIEANEDEGYVVVFARNAEGKKYNRPDGWIATEKHCGVVQILPKPGVIIHNGRYIWPTDHFEEDYAFSPR